MQGLALLTDLYQLTMAYGYWKGGRAEQEAVFHLHFRKSPFGGGYAIAAGLAPAVDWLRDFRFAADDLAFLAGIPGNDGKPLFEPAFLDYLGALRLTLDIDAIPEGTAVFPYEPLVRVKGPILQGQLLETALLCLVNFNTLIATKAARICLAAGGDPVLEFGLRRAQGIDGALSASRAAFIGGCAATSNVSRESASGFRCAARTHIAGLCRLTMNWSLLRLTRPRCPTTASSWSTPTIRWKVYGTPLSWPSNCAHVGMRSSESGLIPGIWPGFPLRRASC